MDKTRLKWGGKKSEAHPVVEREEQVRYPLIITPKYHGYFLNIERTCAWNMVKIFLQRQNSVNSRLPLDCVTFQRY
jgi:hypothetical protein